MATQILFFVEWILGWKKKKSDVIHVYCLVLSEVGGIEVYAVIIIIFISREKHREKVKWQTSTGWCLFPSRTTTLLLRYGINCSKTSPSIPSILLFTE
jgi:hypothetical protein